MLNCFYFCFFVCQFILRYLFVAVAFFLFQSFLLIRAFRVFLSFHPLGLNLHVSHRSFSAYHEPPFQQCFVLGNIVLCIVWRMISTPQTYESLIAKYRIEFQN